MALERDPGPLWSLETRSFLIKTSTLVVGSAGPGRAWRLKISQTFKFHLSILEICRLDGIRSLRVVCVDILENDINFIIMGLGQAWANSARCGFHIENFYTKKMLMLCNNNRFMG